MSLMYNIIDSAELEPQCECVQCDWKGLIEELWYEEETDTDVCPKCYEPVELL